MVVSMKMTAFWDVALCSLIDVDQRFRGYDASIYALMMEAVCISEMSVYFNKTT
jgi:hypothetical protein